MTSPLSLLDPILKPLIRLMIARGVLYPAFAQHLKGLYLDAAREGEAEKLTDSRIALLTGLQRRDIAQLRAAPRTPKRVPATHPSRLVAMWLALNLQDESTPPRRLLPRRGPYPSFEALARAIRKDIHPRTLLDQMCATGTVRLVAQDQVELVTTAYVPSAGADAQLDYLSANLGDHAALAVGNVLDNTQGFERAVHYDGLDQDAVDRLRHAHAEGADALLRRLNALAQELQGAAPPDASGRFRAGAYFHHVPDPKSEETPR